MTEQKDTKADTPPRVSIGMPVYNGEKFLAGAIKSFLAQGFTDFELIISDNCSTDRTGEIARAYAERDARIRYIRQERNIGPARNFAFVLDEARGEFFQWAAHDDLWRPFWLDRAVAALDTDPGIGFAFPSFAIKDNHVGVEFSFAPSLFAFMEASDPRKRLLSFLALHFLSHKCNVVYSLFRTVVLRAAFLRHGLEQEHALASLLVHESKAQMIKGNPFIKRWGILRNKIRKLLPPSQRQQKLMRVAIDADTPVLENLFPDEKATIRRIAESYQPKSFSRDYAVIDVGPLFTEAPKK